MSSLPKVAEQVRAEKTEVEFEVAQLSAQVDDAHGITEVMDIFLTPCSTLNQGLAAIPARRPGATYRNALNFRG